MITNPLTIYCQISETPTKMRPFESTALISAPISVPHIEPTPPNEAGTAEDDGGDGVEFVGLTNLQAVGGVKAGGARDAAEAGKQPGNRIDKGKNCRDTDAGETGCVLATADGINEGAEGLCVARLAMR